VEVQPLIDKVGKKLAVWKGRFLNKSGRLKLVNSVLSALPTYFPTVFKLQKWAIKAIDKFRRGFLWKGTSTYKGGHCLVNWPTTRRPKKFGGLGILDLDLFSRAFRLRWLWFQWTEPDRPWVGTEPPIDAIDRQLFRASTTVTIGDGLKASFWQSSWLHGKAPMDLYPDLYRLAWRKNRSVKEELQNQSWTRGLWRMETVDEMAQFVELWDHVHNVQLLNSEDQIKWNWTTHGDYTSKSAYLAQFNGAYSPFRGDFIWKAEAEGKHKFFAWLLIQSRILTADNLTVRGCPCSSVCVMCDQESETPAHLILHCSFARQVWQQVVQWTANLITVPQPGDDRADELVGAGPRSSSKKLKKNKGFTAYLHFLEHMEST